MTATHLRRAGLGLMLALLLFIGYRAADPGPDPLAEAEAEAHVAAGAYTAAERAYRDALAHRPADPLPALRLAELYSAWDDPTQGQRALDEAIRRGADYARWGSLHIRLLAQAGAWEETIEAATAYLAAYPGDETALRALLDAHLHRRECAAATATAARWLAHAPDNADIARLHALLSGDSALLCPNAAPDCDLQWGIAQLRAGDWPLALCPLERAARADLDAAQAWTAHAWLGETLARLGHSGPARVHLVQATRLAPEQPLGWLLLGTYYLGHGAPAEAEDALWEAHQLDPANPATCLLMGQAQAAAGTYDAIDTWMTAALERAPRDADIHQAVARFYLTRHLRQGDFPERAISGALALAPESAESHLLRGWAELLKNNNEAALSALDTAVAYDPDSGEAHHLRGQALQRLGRPEEAQAAFTRAADLGYR